MENFEMKYVFSAKPYYYSSSPEMTGWVFVTLPKEISLEIRENFKWREEGWGRMKATINIGNSEWQTAIWYDTKQDTHLLPLKAAIRKKEKIILDQNIEITIFI